MELIGRKKAVKDLGTIMKSDKSEFVVIYGRRRIGKTFLINQYFKDKFTFKITGLAKRDKEEQLLHFITELNNQSPMTYRVPKNWLEAFDCLRNSLENKRGKGRKVIFIDELPFMDTPRSNLVTALEHFWNNWASTRDDIVLIVCGSATSWITKKIICNHGGLHNRLTRKIYLKPFSLGECKQYLTSRKIDWTDRDIAECYMIMGGIPFYLSLIEKEKSLAQNVDDMFFLRKGKLATEYDDLYASLFDNSNCYKRVVEALSSKNKGLTRAEIIEATGLPNSGDLTQILDDLDNCDIIRRYKGYGKTERMAIYQLTDFYTFFYFKFIKKHGNSDKEFWIHQTCSPTHNAWSGYAFEQLCLYHGRQIESALGINGIMTEKFAWTSSAPESGAQIDLVIKRADKVVNVCEMKFCDGQFAITKAYWDNLQNKINAFRTENKIKGKIQLVMATTEGLAENKYSMQVERQVTLEDLFSGKDAEW